MTIKAEIGAPLLQAKDTKGHQQTRSFQARGTAGFPVTVCRGEPPRQHLDARSVDSRTVRQ